MNPNNKDLCPEKTDDSPHCNNSESKQFSSLYDESEKELGVFHDTALKDWPLKSFSNRSFSSDTSGESLFSPPLSGQSRSSSGCGFESGQGSRKSPRHSDLRTPVLLSPMALVQEDGRTSVGATSLSKEFGEWNIDFKSPHASLAKGRTSSSESSVLFNPSSFAVPRRGRSDSYEHDESKSKVGSSERVNVAFPHPQPTHTRVESLIGDDNVDISPSEILFQSHDSSVFSPFPNASAGFALNSCSLESPPSFRLGSKVEYHSSGRARLQRSFTVPAHCPQPQESVAPPIPKRNLSQSDSYGYSCTVMDFNTPQGTTTCTTCGQYGNDWGITEALADTELVEFFAMFRHGTEETLSENPLSSKVLVSSSTSAFGQTNLSMPNIK